MEDKRIAYGARCTWWGSIQQVGSNGGLPCCPNCRGMLFEMSSREEWLNSVNRYAETNPGYREFAEWLEGRCYKNLALARQAFAAKAMTP